MADKRSESKHVLITGGLGFIGSTIAHQLVDSGATVTLYDAKLPEYGANMANIHGITDHVEIVEADVRDRSHLQKHVKHADIVYHCAAQLSRTTSLKDPKIDVNINCTGTLNVLRAAADCDVPPRIVFTSSQAVVGKPPYIPIDENTRAEPIDVYGANKRAGEHYCSIYHKVKNVPTVVARLANVYGPRADLMNDNYGVINRFFRLALNDEPLTVFEPGKMKRDFVHVDDVAQALVQLGVEDGVTGNRFMIGMGTGTTINHLAEQIVETAGSGSVELVPWPEEWDSIRVGDIVTDPASIESTIDWRPSVDLPDGIEQTIEFYRTNRESYIG